MTGKASVQVPQEVWQRLQAVSRQQKRDIGEMTVEALSDYLDDLENNRFDPDEAVSNDSVIRWLESWGTNDELPPPKAERRS